MGVGERAGANASVVFKYWTSPVILVMENVLGLAEWFFLRYVALFGNGYKEGCQTVGVTRHKRQVHSPTNNAVKGESAGEQRANEESSSRGCSSLFGGVVAVSEYCSHEVARGKRA